MPLAVYTLTCSLPTAQMIEELSRLTGFLLQAPYAFLQTFHQTGDADIDVFDAQQQLLMRVVLHPEALQGGLALTVPPLPPSGLAPGTLALVQDLTRLWASASAPEI